jgi:hypothetical protein
MHPGMHELMQHWHTNDDAPNITPPISWQGWLNAVGPGNKFGDISQGWGWRYEPAGLTRSYYPEDGVYGDIAPDDGPIALASLPLGVSLALNTDGSVIYCYILSIQVLMHSIQLSGIQKQ